MRKLFLCVIRNSWFISVSTEYFLSEKVTLLIFKCFRLNFDKILRKFTHVLKHRQPGKVDGSKIGLPTNSK